MSMDANVFLEVSRRPGGELCHFPLQVKSLSGKGVILEGSQMPDGFTPQDLSGQQGSLLILGQDKADDLDIPAKVLWVRSEDHHPAEYLVSLELPGLTPEARQVLEAQLPKYPRDIKELWDTWDQVNQSESPPRSDQGVYLVGLTAVCGGLGLYFFLSGNAKVWGSLLAIYGSLIMAGKSLWSMWRKKARG